MNAPLRLLCSVVLIASCIRAAAAADVEVKDAVTNPLDVALVDRGRAATIVGDPTDAEVVRVAAGLLADDISRVTGVKPQVVQRTSEGKFNTPLVLIGTLEQSAVIKGVGQGGKPDANPIAGKWESFLITTVSDPVPGVASALVIAGS